MNSRNFLTQHVSHQAQTYFGDVGPAWIDSAVDAWMNDQGNSKSRFDTIREFLPDAARILDMASGCGTAVFYGLLHGYDMHGIDPEKWKHEFNAMKAREYGYPPEWLDRLVVAVGEDLPYEDNFFDCVTTYQTLEHVQDVERVIEEMLRVTKPDGGVHIRCPDYRSTFEGHYRVPWLPMFPRLIAKSYLRIMGRPTLGLDTINYVTKPKIVSAIRKIEQRNQPWRLNIVDVDQINFVNKLHGKRVVEFPGVYQMILLRRYIRRLFRAEITVNLFVQVINK